MLWVGILLRFFQPRFFNQPAVYLPSLNPTQLLEVRSIYVNYRGIQALVEQNANLALQIADRGYVLEAGCITLTGKASDLLNDERVKKAYLG
jgi:branched-chain amino acid transport system ATP-binding protein